MDTTIQECFTLTCRDVNAIAESIIPLARTTEPRFGSPPRKITYVRVAGMVSLVRTGKAMEGALVYIDDGTAIVQCMVLYDQRSATAAQRLSQHVVSSQPLQGAWVECRGKIALKRHATGPRYEQFCLRLHALHVHHDPYAELHHWQLLQHSRDMLFPKSGNGAPPIVPPIVPPIMPPTMPAVVPLTMPPHVPHVPPTMPPHVPHVPPTMPPTMPPHVPHVPPVALPVRVCSLLSAHVTLSFEQLCAHLAGTVERFSATVLRDSITEMMENGDIYLDNATRTYRLL